MDALMTIDEVADFLGVPKATVYRWNSSGTGPRSYKVGRHVRYRRPEVDKWLDEQASGAVA